MFGVKIEGHKIWEECLSVFFRPLLKLRQAYIRSIENPEEKLLETDLETSSAAKNFVREWPVNTAPSGNFLTVENDLKHL